MTEDDEILQAFIEESREHLDGIVDDLIQIEEAGADLDEELVNQVFRTLHSIKGASGFFGLSQMQKLSHSMENILDRFRQRSLVPTSAIVSVLLDAADRLVAMINDVSASNSMEIDEIVEVLEQIFVSEDGVVEAGNSDESDAPSEASANTESDAVEESAASTESAPVEAASEEGESSSDDVEVINATEQETKPEAEISGSAVPTGEKPKLEVAAGQNKGSGDQSIRVNINLLDKLMALAGELVLTRNELIRSAESKNEDLIQSSVQSVNLITSELQEAIMSTRMQTVGIVFNKFKRIVRDLSSQVGKSINLTITGEDVDMDKTIIEAIGDPLTHLIRNSIDHGIELPNVRTENGKPASGSLHLNAYHSAGQVVIEIKDDGAGINYQKVKKKALENGVVSAEDLDRMSNKEVARLIFKPGFSTAEEVTDISGRGVGMDVVQRNLSKVGGVVDLDSEQGKGTTISIKLPLTLAIIPSLLVKLGEKSFAIPQVNLVELVRIAPGDSRNSLERIGENDVLRVRDQIMPVVSLQELVDLRSAKTEGEDAEPHVERQEISITNEKPAFVVIVASGEFRYGIIVDKLLDSAEIVVKPLGKHFNQSREYAGATILGDGSVALILDVAGVKAVMDIKETELLKESEKEAEIEEYEKHSFLLLSHRENERLALPSHLVSRIEKIETKLVQKVGSNLAIKYKNDTLKLLKLSKIKGIDPCDLGESFYAVVVDMSGLEVGIVASDIHDIINYEGPVDDRSYVRDGIMGSITYQDHIVQLLDARMLIRMCVPELPAKDNVLEFDKRPITVLLVEDSPFFLRQVKKVLEEQEFTVITATNGEEGLKALGEHRDIELIVSDIEMPKMDGFTFVRKLRENPAWKDLPVVALTSLSGEEAEAKGRDAGFTEFQVKLNHDLLIEACARLTRIVHRNVA